MNNLVDIGEMELSELKGKTIINTILKTQEVIRERVAGNIEFSKPIIYRENAGLIYPNTINVIQGKAGVHKSRLVENLCSLVISDKIMETDIGFYKKDETDRYHLLYVDTERNIKDQYPFALQNILKNAEINPNDQSEWFDFLSLIDIERESRFDALQYYINEFYNKINVIIVLDVLTDCISNFNDPRESLKLIDFMNKMINENNVTFLCVIHENPGNGDKARGHIGSEILNKGSLQVQIGFVNNKNNEPTELIKVKYLKVRMGKKPEPFYLIYSDVNKRLELADPNYSHEILNNDSRKASVKEIIDEIPKILKPHFEIERQRLVIELSNKFECSKNTIIARIKSILEDKIEIISDEKSYFLGSEKIGKNLNYILKPFGTKNDIMLDL